MNINRYINAIQNRAISFINSRRGWTTDRKIIVIESDDWGSIRMPSREVYEKSLKAGYRVDLNMFEKYDSLESEEDLIFLFETLSKFKDINGNHPVITANSLVANPDFKKIKVSDKTEYFFETVDKTFASYPKHSKSMDLWYEGEEKGVFFLQYHGREHFNQFLFLNALKAGKEEALWALENKMGGSIAKNGKFNYYVAASDYRSLEEQKYGIEYIREGLEIYKKLHGKSSKSYIATNYTWPSILESVLRKDGVDYLQGTFKQRLPILNKKKHSYKTHFLGEKNNSDQIYIVRNVYFEPTATQRINEFEYTLKQIDKAFKLNKPAIISSHRLNYIGSIFEENRTRNLKQLFFLLSEIQRKWPNVEFMNTVQLGDLINKTIQQ